MTPKEEMEAILERIRTEWQNMVRAQLALGQALVDADHLLRGMVNEGRP